MRAPPMYNMMSTLFTQSKYPTMMELLNDLSKEQEKEKKS